MRMSNEMNACNDSNDFKDILREMLICKWADYSVTAVAAAADDDLYFALQVVISNLL